MKMDYRQILQVLMTRNWNENENGLQANPTSINDT
jgi:hypothetical protein